MALIPICHVPMTNQQSTTWLKYILLLWFFLSMVSSTTWCRGIGTMLISSCIYIYPLLRHPWSVIASGLSSRQQFQSSSLILFFPELPYCNGNYCGLFFLPSKIWVWSLISDHVFGHVKNPYGTCHYSTLGIGFDLCTSPNQVGNIYGHGVIRGRISQQDVAFIILQWSSPSGWLGRCFVGAPNSLSGEFLRHDTLIA